MMLGSGVTMAGSEARGVAMAGRTVHEPGLMAEVALAAHKGDKTMASLPNDTASTQR